ncbi:thioesterase family protein [Mycolicibacterium sp. 018/SC-01/001]|uniref:acyl-CoA thioesterase domain-containing protein n=1 Tax=Mycolicibacterium sp. 018/SC-01/001 TaxID=2592069 RepID=UPI00117DE2D7|nr:acyl-CoA thioesterase domain-containing protein [Mycolicibacterium sp. 018/SC-01/001]TRW89110.1 thioesterase family protein [Mycolicibacterium sp. 018/SC-01/001]
MSTRAFFALQTDDAGREVFAPTEWARGPWGDTISGNYLGGLLGLIGERDLAGQTEGMHPARFTVDLMRPVALTPVSVTTDVVRAGRRLLLADVVMTQDGTPVARASLVYLRRGEQPAAPRWSIDVAMPPLPAMPESVPDNAPMLMFTYGTQEAAAGDGLAAWAHTGPKYVWFCDLLPIVDLLPRTPFAAAAMAGDVASSLTGFGPDGLPFINADYTVSLSRLPTGQFIGLAALTHHSHEGIATGTALLVDAAGPIGTASATALVNPGFTPPKLPSS